MEKMKSSNNQMAFEYAMYKSATLYFAKDVKVKNVAYETRMTIQFREQKSDNQTKMENICDTYLEKVMCKIDDEMFKLDTEVHFLPLNDGTTVIEFENAKYKLTLCCKYNPKKPDMKCFFDRK